MPRALLVLRHTFLICTESILRLDSTPGLPTGGTVVETAVGGLDEARLSGETWIIASAEEGTAGGIGKARRLDFHG
jgi:hypothetical protein